MSKPNPSLFANATFVKASRSNSVGNCVEVAKVDGFYGVRDSKLSDSPVLVFNSAEWDAFTDGVRKGEF